MENIQTVEQKSVVDKKTVVDKKAAIVKSEKDKRYKYDHEEVSGIFRFLECPEGILGFFYGKYKDEDKKYSLKDGAHYKLPRMVVKHLRETGVYPVHKHSVDEDGKTAIKVGKKVRRYTFEIEIEDNYLAADSLITVEKA